MIYLYYISYLNKLEKNETTKEFKKLLKLLFSKPNNDRDIIFADNLNTIFNHQEKRSNINKEDVIKNINQYTINCGNNNTVFCTKDNIVIEIHPSSNFEYILSSSMKPTKGKYISQIANKKKSLIKMFYSLENDSIIEKNDNNEYQSTTFSFDNNPFPYNLFNSRQNTRPEEMKERQELVCSILSLPVLMTYHINIIYYPKEYCSMELDNILKDIDEEDINPMFYSFTSQLGDIFINNKGENELSFKDNFINIQFEFINLKRNKEERKNAIKNNTINIIWTDNPFIDISKQDSLFDSIKSGKENFIITITPKTECHCLIRTMVQYH